MWVLLLILTQPVQGLPMVNLIEKYPTQQGCETARMYVLTEMEKVYPGDTSYTLVCRYSGKQA